MRRRWLAEDGVVEEFPAVLNQASSRRRDKRGWAGVTIAIVLAVIVLAGTVLYSQQSGSLAALGVNIDDLVGVRWKNPTQIQAADNITQDKKRATSMAP